MIFPKIPIRKDDIEKWRRGIWDYITKRPYGELYTHENSVAVVCTDADTPYDLTGLTDGLFYNTTLDASGGTITIKDKGVYRVNFNMSFSLNLGASIVCHYAVYKDDVKAESISGRRDIALAGSVGNASCKGLLSCDKGSVLKVALESDSATKTFDIDHCNLDVQRIRGL
jgi:hypothetical protein